MTENTPRPCEKCGSETRKYDICSRCRQRAEHNPRELAITRAETNRRADIELGMTIEQANWLYNDAMERLRIDDEDQEAWKDKRRAVARLLRENITENTLT